MGISGTVNEKYIVSLCVGLDIFKAKNRLLRLIPDLEKEDIEVTFCESEGKRFIVLGCTYEQTKKKVMLTVSSPNPARHLPSNYQNIDFVRKFLMIFQHIYNETAITLDNLHEFFTPMNCPTGFLSVLSDWFGIHLDTLGGEDEVRRFLQYAIPLYRYRGTAVGLRLYLALVSRVVPTIIEGVLPYSALEISDTAVTEVNLFDILSGKDYFTVYFPVERTVFDDGLVRRLSLIIQQEKPVHTKCFLSFKAPEIAEREVTVISSKTVMGDESGINL